MWQVLAEPSVCSGTSGVSRGGGRDGTGTVRAECLMRPPSGTQIGGHALSLLPGLSILARCERTLPSASEGSAGPLTGPPWVEKVPDRSSVFGSTFVHLLTKRGSVSHPTPNVGFCCLFLFIYEFYISRPTALPAFAAAVSSRTVPCGASSRGACEAPPGLGWLSQGPRVWEAGVHTGRITHISGVLVVLGAARAQPTGLGPAGRWPCSWLSRLGRTAAAF